MRGRFTRLATIIVSYLRVHKIKFKILEQWMTQVANLKLIWNVNRQENVRISNFWEKNKYLY